jgi:electron transfer flavoprotein alpha subunit
VLLTDPAFAGSDTLATATALAAALTRGGPYDLVLAGRNSVDADTGQVGPELAELLDLAFVAGVRELTLVDDGVAVRLEHDDEWVEATAALPAVLSVAERLCDPAKVPPEGRAAVGADRIVTVTAAELGTGPWGQAASPTAVGDVRTLDVQRLGLRLDGTVDEQVDRAVAVLLDRGVLDRNGVEAEGRVPVAAAADTTAGPVVAVVVEPDRARLTRELLGAAARLAAELHGQVIAIGPDLPSAPALGSWGADTAVSITGAAVEEDVAVAVTAWCREVTPWAVLTPGTAWGREVASRTAAALGAGLTGDAVGLTVEIDERSGPRLVAWKPAFGGLLVAAIRSSSPVQLATIRGGVMPLLEPRDGPDAPTRAVAIRARGRVVVASRRRDDNADDLASADMVIGVGQGIDPVEYPDLEPLRLLLGGELAATRKVTDKGWLPRARQIGITGHSIAPRLYVALGLSGKFNHTMGVRSSGTILAVNPDPDALIFGWADIGIVGDWREVVPALVDRLESVMAGP